MSSALRFCSCLGSKMAQTAVKTSTIPKLLANRLPKTNFLVQTSASIVSVAKQDESFKRPPPFPYKEKRYSKLYVKFPFLDPTHLRMNPNSKIITVEGNIGSGKAELAQKLAEQFGWLYMPEPRLDDLYINDNGFDYRTLNKYIDPKLHALDEKMFYENPKHEAVPWFKVQFYRIRYAQYIDALAHLFNTGQGVILERCPASDFVFTDAMQKCGWLPQDAYDYYFRLRYDTIHQLLRPHLIIYLDTDVETSLKRIKEKNIPYQINSKVLTEEYLQTIENSYKERYLTDAGQYSELLIYKWNQPGMIEDMVLDIENLQMDDWDIQGLKFKDWNFYWDEFWHRYRYTYTREKLSLLAAFWDTLLYDVESLDLDHEACEHREEVFKSFVKNYAIQPDWDPNRVGILQQLFGRLNPSRSIDFQCRGPYY